MARYNSDRIVEQRYDDKIEVIHYPKARKNRYNVRMLEDFSDLYSKHEAHLKPLNPLFESDDYISPMSVTQVTDIVAKPMLYKWYVNKGVDYIDTKINAGTIYSREELEEIFSEARKAPYKFGQDAMAIGTNVHNLLESYVLAKTTNKFTNEFKQDFKTKVVEGGGFVKKAVQAFLKWEREHNIDFLFTEYISYCPVLHVCGTIDLILQSDEGLEVWDIKTGSGVYPDHWLQLAAYRNMVHREIGNVVRSGIIHLNKKTGDFNPYEQKNYSNDWNAFANARVLKQWQQDFGG